MRARLRNEAQSGRIHARLGRVLLHVRDGGPKAGRLQRELGQCTGYLTDGTYRCSDNEIDFSLPRRLDDLEKIAVTKCGIRPLLDE